MVGIGHWYEDRDNESKLHEYYTFSSTQIFIIWQNFQWFNIRYLPQNKINIINMSYFIIFGISTPTIITLVTNFSNTIYEYNMFYFLIWLALEIFYSKSIFFKRFRKQA